MINFIFKEIMLNFLEKDNIRVFYQMILFKKR